MGNNDAYTAFQREVMRLYDLDVLNVAVLDACAEPHRGTDIDSGGCMDLQTKDGLSIDEVILKVIDPDNSHAMAAIKAALGPNLDELEEVDEIYYEPLDAAIFDITRQRWGWL